MKKMHILFIGVLPILLLLVTCGQDTPTSVSPSADQTEITLAKKAKKVGVVFFRDADVTTMGGVPAGNQGDPIKGAKFKLKRTAGGISMELKTSKLPQGAYSIWWAIDNDNNTGTGIAPDAAVGLQGIEIIRRATGGLVGANGKGKFEATLPAAPVPPANGVTVGVNIGGQVLDPLGSRIALVIRFHGPVIPGAVDEQTNLFAGGCRNTPTLGAPGALTGGNICFDPQVTEFVAP